MGVNGTSGGSYKGQVPRPRRTVRDRRTVTIQGVPDDPPSLRLPVAQTGVLIPNVIGRYRIFSPLIIGYANLRPKYRIDKTITTEEIETEELVNGILIKRITTVTTITETKTIIGYMVDMKLALCLGPGVHLREIWENNLRIWSGDAGPDRTVLSVQGQWIDDGDGGAFAAPAEVIFHGGAFDQAPDPFLESIYDTAVPGYVGISYIIIKNIDVTGGLRELSFEVERYPNPLGLSETTNKIGDDINVASAIAELITSEWGGAGIDLANIDVASFTTAAATLKTEENGCSLYIQQDTSAIDPIGILQAQSDAFVFHDPESGKIKMKLIRKADYDGLTTPLFDENNVKEVRDYAKSSWELVPSQLRGTFTERSAEYGIGSVVAQNLPPTSPSGIERRTETNDYPTVMTKRLAVNIVSRDLAQKSYPSIFARLQTNRDGAQLLPGDPVVLDWDEYEISGQVFYVKKRRMMDPSVNQVVLDIQEAPVVDDRALFTPGDDGLFVNPDPNAYPPTAVHIVSAPYLIWKRIGFNLPTTSELNRDIPMMISTPYNILQTNFDVYITNYSPAQSPDNPYQTIDGGLYATVGALVGDIGQFDAIEDGIIPLVEIQSVINPSWLIDIEEEGVRQGRVFVYINDEIFSFESATQISGSTWQLTNVHRALLDTAPQEHLNGDVVRIIGNTYGYVSKATYPLNGSPLYVPVFAFVGNSLKFEGKFADALLINDWTPNNRANLPLRPHNTKINGNDRSPVAPNLAIGELVTVSWSTRTRAATEVTLTLDPAEEAETDISGNYQIHRVMIRDVDGNDHDCGATTDDYTYNSLEITIPPGIASGDGFLYVRSETVHGQSQYHDFLPVFIYGGSETTEAGDRIVTEDGAFGIIVEE